MTKQILKYIKLIATTGSSSDICQKKYLSTGCDAYQQSALVIFYNYSKLSIFEKFINLKINILHFIAIVNQQSAVVTYNLRWLPTICDTTSTICDGFFCNLRYYINNLRWFNAQVIDFTRLKKIQTTKLKININIDKKMRIQND